MKERKIITPFASKYIKEKKSEKEKNTKKNKHKKHARKSTHPGDNTRDRMCGIQDLDRRMRGREGTARGGR